MALFGQNMSFEELLLERSSAIPDVKAFVSLETAEDFLAELSWDDGVFAEYSEVVNEAAEQNLDCSDDADSESLALHAIVATKFIERYHISPTVDIPNESVGSNSDSGLGAQLSWECFQRWNKDAETAFVEDEQGCVADVQSTILEKSSGAYDQEQMPPLDDESEGTGELTTKVPPIHLLSSEDTVLTTLRTEKEP